MTREVEELLKRIGDHPLFGEHPFHFVGGTALSLHLDHRVSYDVDIASAKPLPVSAIRALAFSIGAKQIPDRNAAQFRINTGEDLERYYMRFMIGGVKLEFVHFRDELAQAMVAGAKSEPYAEGATLRLMAAKDIAALKTLALFGRRKSRDLFDMAVALENGLMSLEELERIYSFKQIGDIGLREYIESFHPDDDEGDASLDFLPRHRYYRTFAKLGQKKRFEKCKEIFLDQYDAAQERRLEEKMRAAGTGYRKRRR